MEHPSGHVAVQAICAERPLSVWPWGDEFKLHKPVNVDENEEHALGLAPDPDTSPSVFGSSTWRLGHPGSVVLHCTVEYNNNVKIPQILVTESFPRHWICLPHLLYLHWIFMCSYSLFMIIFTGTETSLSLCLFYPRPFVTSPRRAGVGRPEGCRRFLPRLPGGLAKIHRAACQNVDAKRTNVPLRSDFKRETCVWAQAEMMRWCGHADALSFPQMRIQTSKIRMSSIFWPWML